MYKKEPLQENQDRKVIKCRKGWLKETARQMKNEMIKRTGRESCRQRTAYVSMLNEPYRQLHWKKRDFGVSS